jgi:molybdopterin molybdotransferase
MRSVEQALDLVRKAAGDPRRPTETVALAEALGRVLAEDVAMDHDVPPFRRATMDGFALRRADLAAGVRLPVVGRSTAGDPAPPALGAGEAIRIMTGAPLPPEADFVVPFEWTQADDHEVHIREVGRGPNLVEQGAHVAAGEVVLSGGTRVGPGALGALATAGRAEVRVIRPPSVAVLGTGTELVPVGTPPGPGQIRNSNSAALLGQAEAAGARGIDLGIAKDDPGGLDAAIRRGLDADVLLLSGGVSKGDLDLVPRALEEAGVTCVFHRWAVQPGGPLWFGTRGDTLVFGLPGNPAATFVGFELLVRPALDTRFGRPLEARATLRARYPETGGRAFPRRRFRPVTLHTTDDATLEARLLPWRGSGDPFGFAVATGLAVLPEGRPIPEVVEVVPLGGAPLGSGPPGSGGGRS